MAMQTYPRFNITYQSSRPTHHIIYDTSISKYAYRVQSLGKSWERATRERSKEEIQLFPKTACNVSREIPEPIQSPTTTFTTHSLVTYIYTLSVCLQSYPCLTHFASLKVSQHLMWHIVSNITSYIPCYATMLTNDVMMCLHFICVQCPHLFHMNWVHNYIFFIFVNTS